jgi:hypothetical protein
MPSSLSSLKLLAFHHQHSSRRRRHPQSSSSLCGIPLNLIVLLLLLAPPNVFGQSGGGPAKIVVPMVAHNDAASTSQKQPYRLNADFSVQAEVGDLFGADDDHGDGSVSSSSTMIITKHSLSKKQRVKWQMRRYRLHPTFGLLENKLLSHDLLDRHFGYPQAKVLYPTTAATTLRAS